MEVAVKQQDASSTLKILAALPPDVAFQVYEQWSANRRQSASPTAANSSAIIPPIIVTPTNAVGHKVVDIGEHGTVVVDITDISNNIVFKDLDHEKMVVVKVLKSIVGATPEEVVHSRVS
jgi:hypothetical protein